MPAAFVCSSRRRIARFLRAAWIIIAIGASQAFALEVDVNAASIEDLRSLRGVGPQLAERIVRERARGPYRDLEDLRARVRGLGERTVRKLVRHGLRVRPERDQPERARPEASAPRLGDNPRVAPAPPPSSTRP
jgi:competence protein ComEA